MKFKVVDDEEM